MTDAHESPRAVYPAPDDGWKHLSGKAMTEHPGFLAYCRQVRREGQRESVRQVEALLAAGWSMELPASQDPDPMSFYWRRPPRRKGSKGRFFWSTNQAHNALLRELSR